MNLDASKIQSKENSDDKEGAVTERGGVNEEVLGFGIVPGFRTTASLTHLKK